MSRFRAAGFHLLISILVASTVAGLMLGLWYPGQYFRLMGGTGLIFIMGGVDVCLGPLITLIVFRSGKKGLKFDLTMIGLLQVIALAYGVSVMFEARPVFTVFEKDQFLVAAPVDIVPTELALAKRLEWRRFSASGPVLVAAQEPIDAKEKAAVMNLAIAGTDWFQLPRLYVDYTSVQSTVLKHAKPLSALRLVAKSNNSAIDNFLARQSRPETDFVFVPIRTTFAEMAVILDARTAAWIAIIDAAPWS